MKTRYIPTFPKEFWPNLKTENQKLSQEFRQENQGKYSRKLCDWLRHLIGLMWQEVIGGNYVEMQAIAVSFSRVLDGMET
jgi:hypothetical protein